MKRALSIVALTVSIGTASVVSETCHVDFKEVWARKVKAIQQWNRSHASYVARHHLEDPALAANTRRMKERARKALEVMCGQIEAVDLSALGGNIGPGNRISIGQPDLAEGISLDRSVIYFEPLISQEEYPTYDYPTRTLDSGDMYSSGYGGFPGGWFGSAGYLPSGNPSAPPVTAQTPESSTLALSFAPMLALIYMRRKR